MLKLFIDGLSFLPTFNKSLSCGWLRVVPKRALRAAHAHTAADGSLRRIVYRAPPGGCVRPPGAVLDHFIQLE